MNLEDACAAAWERAREGCPACRHATGIFESPAYELPHTCYGDIEAVKAVALAVLAECTRRVSERPFPNQPLIPLVAELDKYLEVKA